MRRRDIENYIKRIAFVIRKERERKDITVNEISEMIGISDSTYRHIERATTFSVSLYRYLHIIELIKVPLSAITETAEDQFVKKRSAKYRIKSIMLETHFDKETYIKEIGKVFKRMRLEQNKTQKYIGDKMKITSHYYGYIERGDQMTISLYRYIAVADILETSFYKVLEEVEDNLNIK